MARIPRQSPEPEPPVLPSRPHEPTQSKNDGKGGRIWVVNPSRSSWFGWLLRYYLLAIVLLLFVAMIAVVVAYRKIAEDLPELDTIEDYASSAPGVTRIYAADGTLLVELARE